MIKRSTPAGRRNIKLIIRTGDRATSQFKGPILLVVIRKECSAGRSPILLRCAGLCNSIDVCCEGDRLTIVVQIHRKIVRGAATMAVANNSDLRDVPILNGVLYFFKGNSTVCLIHHDIFIIHVGVVATPIEINS